MKQRKKMLLALVLAAAMVCGMLTPAFAWLMPVSRLKSPDGVYWFDYNQIRLHSSSWPTSEADPDVTIYSKGDYTVWYSEAGLAYYFDDPDLTDGTWYQHAMIDGLSSPDGGKMWLDISAPYAWMNWESIYPRQYSCPSYLYKSDESCVMRTEPFDGYTQQIPISEFGILYPNYDFSSPVTCEVESVSHEILLSADCTNWTTSINSPDWTSVALCYDNGTLFPLTSFNPRTRELFTADYSLSDSRYTFATASATAGNGLGFGLIRRDFYVKPMRDCTVCLDLQFSAPDFVFAMIDLSGIDPGSEPIILANSDAGLLSYEPLEHCAGTWAIDENGNCIFDTTDTYSGMIPLSSTPVFPSSVHSICFDALANVAYCIPVYLWAEAQSPFACASYGGYVRSTNLNITAVRELEPDEGSLYPITYRNTDDGVIIELFDPEFIWNYTSDAVSPLASEGLSYDPTAQALTLPQTINGRPVIGLADEALRFACEPSGTQYVRQIILPNTVETIGSMAFNAGLQRIHVPYMAQITPETFAGVSGLTLCCDLPNSAAQQTLEGLPYTSGYTYLVCTDHGTSHTHSYNVVVKPATCTEGGCTTYTCSVCGYSYTADETPALGHSFCCYVSDSNATCTEDGTMTGFCDRCGASDTITEEGSTLGHSFTNYVSNNDATCTEDGTKTARCDRCDETDTIWDEGSALGHNFTNYISDCNATCTEDGTKTARCDRCDATDTIPDEGSALNHNWGEWEYWDEEYHVQYCIRCDEANYEAHCYEIELNLTIEPTESEEGLTVYVCRECLDQNVVVIPPLEHEHTYDIVVTPATCTEGGCTTYTCSVCGYFYTADETPALGHSFTNYVSNNDATCTENGTKTVWCDRCGVVYDTITDEGSALGHDYDDSWYLFDDYYHVRYCCRCAETDYEPHDFDTVITLATCTEGGYATYTCSVCGYSYTEDDTPALGHDLGEWIVTKEPTTTEEGKETRACSRCDYTETRPIDRLSTSAAFKVTGGRAHPGQTVQVTVATQNNPGIVATMLHLSYDPEVLTLTAVGNGDVFTEAQFQQGGDLTAVPFNVHWTDAVGQNHTDDGTLVTFTFLVAEDAQPGETAVTITYEPNSTFDRDLQFVPFTVENDNVEVYLRIAGDSDGDGELSLKDVVTLSRYIAGGWDVEIDESAADVDGDGLLTLRDVVLLERYLAGGWGVELV